MALRSDIAVGRFAPGEQLPVEQRLVERFGVSRSVVREAIARLKHDGLVETFQGRGVFVSALGRSNSFRIDPGVATERQDLKQIFELRMMIEAGAAGYAALRRNEEQLAAMRRAVEDIKAAGHSGGDLVEPDVRFHELVAEAAGNRYVKDFAVFVDTQLRASVRASIANGDTLGRAEAVHREHLAIYRAIENGDPDAARHATLDHLTDAARALSLDVLVPGREYEQMAKPGRQRTQSGGQAR